MARISSDEALVTRARNKDTLAEQELVARYSFLVATVISKEDFLSRAGTRDDLIQQGYIGLLAAIRTYRDKKGATFKTYASICIRNEILSALRSESSKKHGMLTAACSLDDETSHEGEGLLDTLSPTPEERLLGADYAHRLSVFVATKLSPREQDVLARYAQGYSYSEIARQLGATTKAVDGTVQRIRKKMVHFR